MATTSILIPTLTDPFYSIIVALDGTNYILDFNYSTREDVWYFNISDVENNLLLAGIKVVCLYPLAAYYQNYHNLPPGTLFCASGTNDNSPPGIYDLGENRRCQLVYYPINQSVATS